MPELQPGQSEEVSPPASRGAWWPRLVLVAAVAGAAVAYYATGLNERLNGQTLRANLDTYRDQVRASETLAVVVFFGVYVLVAATSLPVAVWLSLLAGALFGRWLGTAVVIVAATSGATLAFLSSRYLFRDFVRRRFGGRLAALNAGVERDGAYYLFTMRLIPAIPFWLINLGMGLTPMRVATFAAVSFVGMLPGTFLYVNAGTELANINSPRDVVSLPVLGSLVLLGVLPLVLRKVWPSRPQSS
jgi:uncharacterized membrane protein YdjX (TVP38/TMEM64 family)